MDIKDQATATEAALNLDKPGAEVTPKEGEPTAPRRLSTTEKLFPENIAGDGLIVNRPVRPYTDKDKALPNVVATPTEAIAPETPNPPAPTVPGELDLSKMPDGTMVRIKVDGVEMTVPAKDALKNIQLERHLTLKSQELARDRAALEAERASFRQAPAPVPKGPEVPPPPLPAKGAEDPRIAVLQQQIAELSAAVAPQRFQYGLNVIAQRAKAELGATDFLEYAPKIKAFVDGELAKPEVAANPALVAQLDNSNFWYGKYQEMKLRDVLSGQKPAAPVLTPSSVIPAPTLAEAPAGTMLVLDKNNRPVVVPNVEGSNGVPSRIAPDENWQMRYAAAFKTAQETGDWKPVFSMKYETGRSSQ